MEKVKIDNLGCIVGLANARPAESSIMIDKDGLDATVTVVYESGPDGKTSKTDVKLSMLNSAYVGMVALWPMMKEVKEQVLENQRKQRDDQKKKDKEEKENTKAKEKAEAKKKREEEAKKKREEKEKAKADKAAARAKEKKEREDKKAAEDKAKADAKAKADEEKKKADEAKKKEDTAKAQKAANDLAKKGQLPAGKAAKK